ncbi:fibroblast growth factor receptor homolog 1-like [Haliotis rufescens]|uniref:fibroblast growth factor receptor homolog 1-like n=1 Tax=Haliotis rufescens TaxID=6454 RepID=UPI00201F2B79|nr:fibroblast growth factor receptor homolog 1-like [Haliotis rufescens]
MQPLLLLCVVAVSSGRSEGQGMAPPSFVNPDPTIGPTQVFYSGEGAQVNCEANGNPRPTVKLSQRRTTLTMTTSSQGVFQNVTEGTYQCVAENQYGTARSDNIHVRHVCIPGRQSLEARCHVCTGHHTTLQCWPVREGAMPHYSWTFRSKEVPVDERHYIDVKGKLHIVNVNDNDTGFYTCETKYTGGQVTPFTSNTTLSIRQYCNIGYLQTTLGYLLAETEKCPGSRPQTSPLVPGTDQWPNPDHTTTTRRPSTKTYNHLTTSIDPRATLFPPDFWTSPWPYQQQSSSDLKAALWTYQKQPLYGDPLTLECLCQGPPGTVYPNITWSVPMATKSKLNTTADMYHRRLVIGQVDHSDTGNYTCICSNSSGHTVNSTTEVTIQDPRATLFPPDFWTSPWPYQQQSSSDLKAALWTYQKQPLYGDPLTLECLCQGPPDKAYPNITWSVPMATKSKLNTTADMYHRRLVIGQVDHSDTGNYTCICSNSSGHTANSTKEVTIQAKYMWVTQPVPQDVEIGGKATFICAAKWSDNRICEANTTWYINDGPISEKSLGCPLCAVINNSVLFQYVNGPEANKNIQCHITCAGQSLYYNSYLHVDETDSGAHIDSGTSMATIGGLGGAAAFIFICVLVIFKRRKWIKMKWYKRKMDQSLKFRLELAKYNRSSHYVKFPTHTDEFPIDRLRFLDTLGAGNFGKVMKAEALDIAGTGKWELVAVKMCKDTATDAEKGNLYHETVIMRKVPRHINVVTYLSYVASSEPTLLIMEYVPGGNLLQFLRNRRPQKEKSDGEGTSEGSGGEEGEHREEEGSQKTEEKTQAHDALDQMNLLSSRDLSSFALQIAKGMAHVATHNIIHRDLAARNVLLGLGNVCKISDFGLSRDMEGSDEYEVSSMGPLPIRWMSPESLTDGLYTLKSDVWSYGVLLWELVTLGASPYSGQSARQVMTSVKEGRRLEKPDCCSDHVYKLMTQCWRPHPGDRSTFSDLADTIEGHLEEEAEYVQLSNFDVNIYDVIDMGDMDVAEEKV